MLDCHGLQSQCLLVMVKILVVPVKPGIVVDGGVGLALTPEHDHLPLYHAALWTKGHMQPPGCIWKEKQDKDAEDTPTFCQGPPPTPGQPLTQHRDHLGRGLSMANGVVDLAVVRARIFGRDGIEVQLLFLPPEDPILLPEEAHGSRIAAGEAASEHELVPEVNRTSGAELHCDISGGICRAKASG